MKRKDKSNLTLQIKTIKRIKSKAPETAATAIAQVGSSSAMLYLLYSKAI